MKHISYKEYRYVPIEYIEEIVRLREKIRKIKDANNNI